MNSMTANLYAADAISQSLIQDRVHDARRRNQVRAARAARRAERQAPQPARPQSTHDLPWWTLRFLSPVR
jgi:hypothetical protein